MATRSNRWNSACPTPRPRDLVREHAELLDAVVAAQDLDERIGIGERGRLVAHHDQHVLRGLGELQHAAGDARRGVDDHHVELAR